VRRYGQLKRFEKIEDYWWHNTGQDVVVGVIYKDANIKVVAVENTHFGFHKKSSASSRFKSYSYRFETPDRVIVFTGDTGPSEAITKLSNNADILVSEVNSVEDRIQRMIRACTNKCGFSGRRDQCPLCHQKRTFAVQQPMSAMSQKQPFAVPHPF